MSDIVNEITSTGSIASVPMGTGGKMIRRDKVADREWVDQLKKEKEEREEFLRRDTPEVRQRNKEQLEKAKKLLADRKKPSFKTFVKRRFLRRNDIKENFDMDSIISRLKSLEIKNSPKKTDTVTYGIEDDSGNIMKVTVKKEVAREFEDRLGLELGRLESGHIQGVNKPHVSLAELLFTLKDEFQIIDVEFPEIPSDVIYNADKASYNVPTNNRSSSPMDDTEFEDDLDTGLEDEGLAGEMETLDIEDDDLDLDVDDDSVEDFEELSDEESTEASLYKELIQMLTKQAEATKAQAEAEAEKARALQAEHSARSANVELARQEELARMEAQIERGKEKQKEAKRLADLAKFRVQQTSSQFEGYSALMNEVLRNKCLTENEDLVADVNTENVIRSQLTAARSKYASTPNDDPETANYKQQMLAATNTELNAKLRKVQLSINRKNKLKSKQNQQNTGDRLEDTI